ncbi:hypothetical protein SeMB42_g01697 [Synchytrium endobioticum]|uniref:Dynein regulatory complex protein 10 n=1 Tax=Synchytrium endobioticum TaxID=286115 RepID=A0A507DMC1_9FUNG|nr:hypothetical protein SeLEV6574_g03765 [Synchytrium endobioticum]TPX52028.1 hypothetical protein SeMB42_g01697 [Synchytrium endobioticum]
MRAFPAVAPAVDSYSSSKDTSNSNDMEYIWGDENWRLPFVEAQRTIAVLSEASRKAAVIHYLSRASSLPSSLSGNASIRDAFTTFKKAQLKAEELTSRPNNENELKEATEVLRSSARQLCRVVVSSPSVLSQIKQLASSLSSAFSHNKHHQISLNTDDDQGQRFLELLGEVRVALYERLRISADEEKTRAERLAALVAKEQKTAAEATQLTSELEAARVDREKQVKAKTEVVKKLKDELETLKAQNADTVKKLELKSRGRQQAELQNFAEKEVALKAEIETLSSRLDTTIKSNREEESNMRRRKFKIESEVENWIHKYDQDMEEKQNEYEELLAVFLEEKAQLDEISFRHKQLQNEYNTFVEERAKNRPESSSAMDGGVLEDESKMVVLDDDTVAAVGSVLGSVDGAERSGGDAE